VAVFVVTSQGLLMFPQLNEPPDIWQRGWFGLRRYSDFVSAGEIIIQQEPRRRCGGRGARLRACPEWARDLRHLRRPAAGGGDNERVTAEGYTDEGRGDAERLDDELVE